MAYTIDDLIDGHDFGWPDEKLSEKQLEENFQDAADAFVSCRLTGKPGYRIWFDCAEVLAMVIEIRELRKKVRIASEQSHKLKNTLGV